MSLFDTDLFDTPERLTPAVLQAAELLGLYRAELARILGLQCEDVGALAEIRALLEPNSKAWKRAQVFVGFYQSLDKVMQGNAVDMCHWLRRHNEALGNAPFYLIVDEGRLDDVFKYLQESE